jgi:hypothetical protein
VLLATFGRVAIVARSTYLSPGEWTTADWAGLTFGVLLAAAVVALLQTLESRKLRQQQIRPFVVVDFAALHTVIELTITNVGKTLARDVQFEFNPQLLTTHDQTRGTGPVKDLNVFTKGIPSLAPGKEIRLFFDQFPARIEARLPLRYDALVTYKGPTGRKRHKDRSVLDLEVYLGTGGITRHDLHDVHNRLKEMADAMKRWTDFDGLKVLTREDLKIRRAEYDAFHEEQSRAAEVALEQEPEPSDESSA